MRPNASVSGAGGNAGAGEPAQPLVPGEEALDVAVVLDRDPAAGVAQQDGVVHHVGVVGQIGIPAPLQPAKSPAVGRVVAVVLAAGFEGLAHVVGQHGHRAARAAMDGRGPKRRLDGRGLGE